jgi:hypothetical protein
MVLSVSDADYARIVGYIKSNEKINAIKALRTASFCGLREAKDAVEAMGYDLGVWNTPVYSPAATIQQQGFMLESVRANLSVKVGGVPMSVPVIIDGTDKVTIGDMVVSVDALRAILDAAASFFHR